MKLLVCGSRTITSYDYVSECLDSILQEYGDLIKEIVEGEADGVDKLSALWANEHFIKVKKFPIESEDWKRYGKRAGYLRNKDMVDYSDGGVAIWDGYSRGTKITIYLLKEQNKLIRVFK